MQERIREALSGAEVGTMQPPHLMPFVGNPREEMPKGLPFRLSDYLKLVDWTGRVLRDDKRGTIPADAPPILERLEIDPRKGKARMEVTATQECEGQLVGRLVGEFVALAGDGH